MNVAHDPDVGRRVIQCRCGRARAWTGRKDALTAGWASRWVDERRVWDCPEHRVEATPATPPGPPDLTTPAAFFGILKRGARGEVAKLRADLARVLEVDPVRGRAWTKDVLASAVVGKGEEAKRWRVWASEHGLAVTDKQPRKARTTRRKAA